MPVHCVFCSDLSLTAMSAATRSYSLSIMDTDHNNTQLLDCRSLKLWWGISSMRISVREWVRVRGVSYCTYQLTNIVCNAPSFSMLWVYGHRSHKYATCISVVFLSHSLVHHNNKVYATYSRHITELGFWFPTTLLCTFHQQGTIFSS